MATVTKEDRALAHALFKRTMSRHCISNTDVAAVACADLAQLAADARERERALCYAAVCLLRCANGHGPTDDGCPCFAAAEQAIAARRSK